MTPNQATRELYKLFEDRFFEDRSTMLERVTYDKVKTLIDAGARLTGIDAIGGISIIWALEFKYDISIIRLLAESGGIDMDYITAICGSIDYYSWHCDKHPDNRNECDDNCRYESEEDEPFGYCIIIDKRVILYKSIKNSLIKLYHSAIGSNYVFNTLIKECYRQGYSWFNEIVILQDTNIVDEEKYKYVEQCCEIFNITIDELKHMKLDIPPDMRDSHDVPINNHSYNYPNCMDDNRDTNCSCCSCCSWD
jgi:hypothetical protein